MRKETIQCDRVSPVYNITIFTTVYSILLYRADVLAHKILQIFFLRKWKAKLGTFNITLKLNLDDYI